MNDTQFFLNLVIAMAPEMNNAPDGQRKITAERIVENATFIINAVNDYDPMALLESDFQKP